MTKRLMMIALMVLSIVCLAFGVAACAPTEVEHPETGMYYFETDEGDTYHVTLEGGSFMLQIADEIESGTYVVNEDGTMTLSFANENAPSVSMTYQDSELSVVYNGSSMMFMRTISYTVSYETLGGSKVNSAKVMNGKSIVKPSDPEREGYAFLGWYTDADYTNAFVFGVTRITADTTLYARWSNPMTGESEHTILFDLGYEGAVNPAAQETVAGQLYNVETPTREGYRFGGWWISDYESSDKLTYLYSEDYKFTSSTTLYAQWISTASGAQLASPMPRIEGNMVV